MNRGLSVLFALSLGAMADVACAAALEKSDARVASSRQALLIANADYPDADVPLRHPVNDAHAIADELRRAGFEVAVGENLTRQSMQNAITDFKARIEPGSAALIFFSGYGIQVNKQNYLIPVNAQIWSEEDVRRHGIALESILVDMDGAAARVKLAIIDASRENPFERRYRRSSAGLASIEVSRGTLVVYAAEPEKVMTDADGENGLFVGELLKEIRSTGRTAEQIFVSAARSVSRASNGRQVPWLSSSLAEAFYFTQRPLAADPLRERRKASKPAPNDKAARDELAKFENAPSAGPPLGYQPVDERAISERRAVDQAAEFVPSSSRPVENPPVQRSESKLAPLLVQGSRWMSGEPAPLGLTLQGQADGAAVMITGLAPGMTLSIGEPISTNAWQLPATDLANVWIAPPEHFIGAVDLVAELRLADATIAIRQPMHIEWIATTPPAARQVPAVAPLHTDIPAPHQVDQDQVAMLIERGKDLLASGDLAAARIVLDRAATSKSAEAAFLLATTYDPLVLRELRVYGFPADVAAARVWYEKAKELGSAEATRRLEVLATALKR